jgi:hypothetical protein
MAELSDIREAVRTRYAKVARDVATDGDGCCGGGGCGCGVPTAVAELRDGETVLDLGSGAGADV